MRRLHVDPAAEYEELRRLLLSREREQIRELRERISADLRAVGADEELPARFSAMGMGVRVTSPAELQTIVADERAALARLTQRSPQ